MTPELVAITEQIVKGRQAVFDLENTYNKTFANHVRTNNLVDVDISPEQFGLAFDCSVARARVLMNKNGKDAVKKVGGLLTIPYGVAVEFMKTVSTRKRVTVDIEAMFKVLSSTPGMTDKMIAGALGLSISTIVRMKADSAAATEAVVAAEPDDAPVCEMKPAKAPAADPVDAENIAIIATAQTEAELDAALDALDDLEELQIA